MNSQFVRIESITIENFKNVRKGVLDFEIRRKKYRTSIVVYMVRMVLEKRL